MPRTLVLMRHAQAEPLGVVADLVPGEDGAGDHERALTTQGRGDARVAGQWLADTGLTVDVAVVSTATRALETLEEVASRLAVGETLVDDTAYHATAEELLQSVRRLPDDVDTAMLVAHAPSIGDLAMLLDDGDGEPALRWQLPGGLPTAGLVVLTVPTTWAELGRRGATVVELTVGRQSP